MFRINKSQGENIRQGLLTNQHSISVAESVTAGLLQYALSTIPDASKFLQGGITAFNIAQKARHLHIDQDHALLVNCVSEQVAKEMAVHCCRLFSSHWGIGITGYASPVPESGDQSFAYFAIAFMGEVTATGRLVPTMKDPPDIQLEYVHAIVDRLEIELT